MKVLCYVFGGVFLLALGFVLGVHASYCPSFQKFACPFVAPACDCGCCPDCCQCPGCNKCDGSCGGKCTACKKACPGKCDTCPGKDCKDCKDCQGCPKDACPKNTCPNCPKVPAPDSPKK